MSSRPTEKPRRRDRAVERAVAAHDRYEHSWAGHIAGRLNALDFGNWITMFGASLLWSALPLIILLSSFANATIDDDISRHIGLNSQGAQIVHSLFRGTPSHAVGPVVTGFLFSFAGVVAVVSSLQLMYERIFDFEPRGWRNFGRWVIWVAVLFAAVMSEGAGNGPVRHAGGQVAVDAVAFVNTTLFFWWTMHFVLAGRAPWRDLIRPAVATGALWLGLEIFSQFYFSDVMLSDSRTYGTIGVVFTLLTWFFLIGGVIVLGAVLGSGWQARARPPAPAE